MLEEAIPTAISTWFTPTFLFLAFNLVIGIVAITSSFGSSKHKQPLHPQLVRGPSTVIERLKSINLYHFKTEDFNPFSSINGFHQPDPTPQQQQQHHLQQQQPLARAPSILERLKSINLYHYKPDDFNPFGTNIHHTEHQEEETTTERKLQSTKNNSKNRDFLDHRALDNKKSKVKVFHQHDTQQQPISPAQKQRAAAAIPLARAPSILERLKSINLYQDFIPFHKQPVDTFPDQDDFLDHRALEKKKSVTKKTSKKKKLFSAKSDVLGHFGEFDGHQDEDEFLEEKRQNLTAKEKKSKSMNVKKVNEFSEDEEVDAKADDFINRFKNQLKLQRLDSIMQYKDLLTNKK